MPDYRLPEYRREVFLRFYEFHLKWRSHPGCVYYLMPYLSKHWGWNQEEKLWFAYINGNTQNPVMSFLIEKNFPSPAHFLIGGREWFNDNWARLQWDTDRRYQKKDFPNNVDWFYQSNDFDQLEMSYDVHFNFQKMWKLVRRDYPTFGRLSAFSYLEYLRIMGVPIDCDDLFLEDMEGSKSHRNGLAIVLGRNDLDWHGAKPNYTPEILDWLKREAANLLSEMKYRSFGASYVHDISYFTLESTLCTYKSWHRPNRRYPNVYNDMLYERIKWAEKNWPEEDFSVFWEARKQSLPEYLRLEDNPNDPGLSRKKQNYYRENGIPIMMSRDFPEFNNEFDRKIWSRENSLTL